MSHGLTTTAERALESALAVDPANREVRTLRGQVFRHLGRSDKALSENSIAASLTEDSAAR
jgi:Tfp pilus assembly protein PilF